MNLVETQRQKSMQMELPLKLPDEVPAGARSVEELTVKHETQHSQPTTLMHQVVEKTNMQRAYKRVKRNKGSAGIDGMEVADLKTYLTANWNGIKEQLLNGTYQPKAVKKVEIQFSGNSDMDIKLANKMMGWKETPDNMVWHHSHDRSTMMLIDENLHKAVRHTGGDAITRATLAGDKK